MKLKPLFLIFAALLLLLVGCADDSSDDGTTWTEIFSDDFTRPDTTYIANASDTLGLDYNVRADDTVGGTIQITSNEVACGTKASAEYQTPLTVDNVKLTLKFRSDAFSNNAQDGVYLQDAITAPAGCQVSAGYFSDGTGYALYILDKDTSPPDILATAAVTLSVDTEYMLEMAIDDGAVTGTIKSSAGATLAIATASAASTSNKYADCLMQEPSFSMNLTGTVHFDDFTISTGD